jgi:hypothetical protein
MYSAPFRVSTARGTDIYYIINGKGDDLPSTTVVVFFAAPRCACNAHVSPALDVSVAIGTTLRPVPAQDSLSIPTTRSGDALPALLAV